MEEVECASSEVVFPDPFDGGWFGQHHVTYVELFWVLNESRCSDVLDVVDDFADCLFVSCIVSLVEASRAFADFLYFLDCHLAGAVCFCFGEDSSSDDHFADAGAP